MSQTNLCAVVRETDTDYVCICGNINCRVSHTDKHQFDPHVIYQKVCNYKITPQYPNNFISIDGNWPGKYYKTSEPHTMYSSIVYRDIITILVQEKIKWMYSCLRSSSLYTSKIPADILRLILEYTKC